MMYKIYDVSGNTMNLVYAYTNCLPIGMDLLLRQLTFLMNCRWINNYVVKFVFEYFGHHDVYDMTVFTSLAFPTWTCSVVGVCQGCCAGLCHLWCNCQLFWVVHWTAQVDSCAAGAAVCFWWILRRPEHVCIGGDWFVHKVHSIYLYICPCFTSACMCHCL